MKWLQLILLVLAAGASLVNAQIVPTEADRVRSIANAVRTPAHIDNRRMAELKHAVKRGMIKSFDSTAYRWSDISVQMLVWDEKGQKRVEPFTAAVVLGENPHFPNQLSVTSKWRCSYDGSTGLLLTDPKKGIAVDWAAEGFGPSTGYWMPWYPEGVQYRNSTPPQPWLDSETSRLTQTCGLIVQAVYDSIRN